MEMPKNIIMAAEKDDIYKENVAKIGDSHENIKIYNDVLKENDLESLLSFCKNAVFSDGGDDEQDEWHNRVLEAESVPENIFLIMSKVYDFAEKELQDFYGVQLDPWTKDSFSILVWRPGDSMGEHVPEWAIHHHNICTTFYINDGYDDGEIEFSGYDLKISVAKNSLMAFPGNEFYKNSIQEVKGNNKYTANLCFKFSGSSFLGEASFE
jgi:hypothetical protein